MSTTGRDDHLIAKALALALEIYSRAHPRHVPDSDVDDMATLYTRLCPDDVERWSHAHSVHWLLLGGLDLREREEEPVPAPAPLRPLPAPGGGERIAA